MGMDVYGIDPRCEKGVYFRRSVWGWHPLWTYCEVRHPDVAGKVQFAHTNDGDGLNAVDAELLGSLLLEDVESGAADEYCRSRDLIISALPSTECNLCGGTGIRTDQVGTDMLMPTKELQPDQAVKLGRQRGWCNGCNGEGTVAAFERSYFLTADDIAEFGVFAARSGGFKIL